MNLRDYQIEKELGRGSFGVTYLATEIKSGKQVAMKQIDIPKAMAKNFNLKDIQEEAGTLRILTKDCPPFLACYYGGFIQKIQGIETAIIISEYIEGSSLSNFIQQNNQKIEPRTLWPIFLQLLLGLKYIHDHGYAHRDIKPDNIMITKDMNIKYIDFGLACLDKCRREACSNLCKGRSGTLLYMPPEFFTETNEESLKGAKAHDIWSLTMIFHEMGNAFELFPFDILGPDKKFLSSERIAEEIAKAPKYFSEYPLDDGRTDTFINSLLINDWRQRPTIDDAIYLFLEHVLTKVPLF